METNLLSLITFGLFKSTGTKVGSVASRTFEVEENKKGLN
jgi:hypothetical protein